MYNASCGNEPRGGLWTREFTDLTPMAIVILFGLLSSTLLNMLVVPALFMRFGRLTDNAVATAISGELVTDGGAL